MEVGVRDGTSNNQWRLELEMESQIVNEVVGVGVKAIWEIVLIVGGWKRS